MELFNVCRKCQRLATPTVHQRVGTMMKIAAECEFCGFTLLWCSQQHVGFIPAGNIGLSASILFSGALPSKVLQVLRCMWVATITQRTFSNHLASLLFPVVARVWDRQRRDYVIKAEDRGNQLLLEVMDEPALHGIVRSMAPTAPLNWRREPSLTSNLYR